jgi:hypothetical protein
MILAFGLLGFDYLRIDRKEKILAKQKELDNLIVEMKKACS